MPCYDGQPSREEIENSQLRIENARLRRENALLCATCRVLARLGYDFDENPELSEWWERHKELDKVKAGKL